MTGSIRTGASARHHTTRPTRPRARTAAGLLAALALAIGLVLAPTGSLTAAPQAHAAEAQQTKQAAKRAAFRALPFSEKVVRIARTRKGTPYRYGATGPKAFDCSGYTSWVYARLGKKLPRTSRDQAASTRRVSRSDAKRGDLVFFHSGKRVYHVGIFAGKNRIWHAPYGDKTVGRERIWTKSFFFGRVKRPKK